MQESHQPNSQPSDQDLRIQNILDLYSPEFIQEHQQHSSKDKQTTPIHYLFPKRRALSHYLEYRLYSKEQNNTSFNTTSSPAETNFHSNYYFEKKDITKNNLIACQLQESVSYNINFPSSQLTLPNYFEKLVKDLQFLEQELKLKIIKIVDISQDGLVFF